MFKYIRLNLNNLNNFSISDLARFSGIKPHTIRVWEQRYKALQPHRSEGNTRYYDDLQLRRLLNIVSLLELDHKISTIAAMPDEELFSMLEQKVLNESENQYPYKFYTLQLIKAGMSYDEPAFEKLFSHVVLHLGMKQTYLQVLYPLLVQVGLMWSANKMPPAQEHFISNLLRQKMYTAIDGIPPAGAGARKWLLFLPEDEFHELGLLLAYYLLRISGEQCIYLGANVPATSAMQASKEVNPHFLLTFFIHNESKSRTESYLKTMIKGNAGSKIFVAGNMSHNKKTGWEKQVTWLCSVDELLQQVV